MSFFGRLSEKPGFRQVIKVLKNKYFIVTAAFLIWIFFFDTNNLISWYRDLKQLGWQNRQKVYYQDAIRQADEKLQELASNKDSLEKFAREQFLFHEAGEDVYVVEDEEEL
ncbi:MAG: septum formation inhibitor [Bacteroidales bacterium]|jgi:hypothetical protein|nr:septum formation inhibitor [Bacteroidales bacterium]